MRVLLIGKGGREHALAWKITKSALTTELYVWPGNAAIAVYAKSLALPPDATLPQVVASAVALGIDLVVPGPEAPLSEGLADLCLAAGLKVFGPSRAAAQLEASKAFAKDVMQSAKIPTAAFHLAKNEAECRNLGAQILASRGGVVLKASGLAAGKGVFVCQTAEELLRGLDQLYRSDLTQAAATVVVEEVLRGRECSFFTWLGDKGSLSLGFAVDFKRLEDKDVGPNTGGMGCYTPVPWLPKNAAELVQNTVVKPLLKELARRDLTYRGCLYVGLMWSPTAGPQVIEFNVRLGDPEAQVLALADDRDWLAVMAAQSGLSVDQAALDAATKPLVKQTRAVGVVMASSGYPYGKDRGQGGVLPTAFFAPPQSPPSELAVTFAGSISTDQSGLATGIGRVLTVTASGETFQAARAVAYQQVAAVAKHWPDARWRTDIGERVAQEFG